MRGRMRVHVIAIGAITAVVFIMFLIVGPKNTTPQQTQFAGNNYVQISSATWGLNCNTNVKHEIKQAQIKRSQMLYSERNKVEIPKIITRNNAITHLSDLCNGKETCNFLAESDVIGLDPIYSCFKELELSYRCFDIDRLRHLKIKQGNMVRIECAKDAIAKADQKK